jgi:glutamate-1-semialdehyde 2,1-aminomutase
MAARSETLYARASELMPGGVNSAVRAFRSVEGTPPFIERGEGATLTDVDGQTYLDFVQSWGPLILGHAHPKVVEAVRDAAGRGLSFGACHEGEVRLAGQIRRHMPHVEMLRLVNSGTEAGMSALRLARAATGRDHIIKFQGCYHGHADSFLIAAGSGALTFGTPSSPGVPAGAAEPTLVAQFNDLDSVEACFGAGKPVAAVFVEPVAGNMGVIPPAEGFLQGLRKLCDRHGALLVFDEVITGFRIGLGGAAAHYGVTPDLTALGKIIGGGMPVGAFGGRADLMRQMSPDGPVYQGGTLSGNPLACAAGSATLEVLEAEDPYPMLDALSDRLATGLLEAARAQGIVAGGNRIASMSTLFFGVETVTTHNQATQTDTRLYAKYHSEMLKRGFYLAPSQFEATFVSAAHTESDIDRFLEASREAMAAIQREGEA